MDPHEIKAVKEDPRKLFHFRFSQDLFYYLVKNTIGFNVFTPVKMAGASAFKEKIGVSIGTYWMAKRDDLLKQVEGKLPSTVPDASALKMGLRAVWREFLYRFPDYNIFESVKHLSAMLLEVIHVLFKCGYQSHIHHIPECWFDIFELYLKDVFYQHGGFEELYLKCL